MFILFRPIKDGEDINRHCLIVLASALIITLVILVIALTTKSFFLTAQDEAARKQRWVAESALRESNAPMGTYERVPGGWKNLESGEVFKDAR